MKKTLIKSERLTWAVGGVFHKEAINKLIAEMKAEKISPIILSRHPRFD